MTRTLSFLATLIVVATGAMWALKSAPVQPNAKNNQHQTGPHTSRPKVSDFSTQAPPQTLTHTLANSSLAGTQAPGNLTTDTQGQLIADSHSKAIMDYFLSLSGEMPDDAIGKLLEHWTRQNAGQLAATELLALFDQYRDYRAAFASGDYAAHHTGNGETDIRHQLQQRQQLRIQHFGLDTATALFTDEDRYDLFSLERYDIMHSQRTEKEKSAALGALRNTLPDRLARQYQQQHDLEQLPARQKNLALQGATATDLYTFHQQHFGDAAALRLQALATQRLDWQNRYQQYAQQRDQITHAALSEADKQDQLAALQNRLFTPSEQRRAAALDRLR